MITLQRLRRWQAALRRITERSRFVLSAEEMQHYNALCIAGIREILSRGEEASILRHDPNGHDNLRRAKEIRRKLRELRRRQVPIERFQRRFAASLARSYRHGPPSADLPTET
jgi:hypothetical protein